MKEHCYYCEKALYKMFLKQGIYTHEDDKEVFTNSECIRICEKCCERIIPRDTYFACPHCAVPIYQLREDHFRENAIKRKHLKGIAPQPDPYTNAFIKCRHCKQEVDTWE